MSWVQVKSPNLNVQASLGMCLKYVQDAYGSGWAGSYALQGWRDIVKNKHADWNIPSGVYVPIWFEGYWNGFNYGHTAIYKDGTVWSSPYTYKDSYDRLGSIQEVERIYGMKYIGWSEDIGGTTVITKEETMSPYELNLLAQIAWNRPVTGSDKFVKDYTGKSVQGTLEDVLKSAENVNQRTKANNYEKQLKAKDQRIKELEAQLSGKATPLKPGVYEVK